MSTTFRPVTRNDRNSQFEAIWTALESYREDCIPEGQDPDYDAEWSEICTVMAWWQEDLEQLDNQEA